MSDSQRLLWLALCGLAIVTVVLFNESERRGSKRAEHESGSFYGQGRPSGTHRRPAAASAAARPPARCRHAAILALLPPLCVALLISSFADLRAAKERDAALKGRDEFRLDVERCKERASELAGIRVPPVRCSAV